LKVSGFFKLTADSDDFYGEGYLPFDTMIAVIPEPATLSLLGLGGLALIRRRK
jgi:hypothetical protein